MIRFAARGWKAFERKNWSRPVVAFALLWLAAISIGMLKANSLTNARTAPKIKGSVSVVYVNDDDGNENLEWDKNDAGPVPNTEPSLVVGSYEIIESSSNAYQGESTLEVKHSGDVKLWEHPEKKVAYSGTAKTFLVEGLSPSSGTRSPVVTINWYATEPEADGTTYLSSSAVLKTGVWQVDLDVDSDNNGAMGSDAEDKIEASKKDEHPGKIVVISPNFASGLEIDGAPPGAPVLVPMNLDLKPPFEPGTGLYKAKMRLEYKASIPRLESERNGHIRMEDVGGKKVFSLTSGGLRVWKSTSRKRANVQEGGDFIPPDTWIETETFGTTRTVYVEYVDLPGATGGKQQITLRGMQFVPELPEDPITNTVCQSAYNANTFDTVSVYLLPVEMELRAAGNIEPSPENDSYEASKASAGGTDQLGTLPMGSGRADYPNQAYTAPIQVIGKVSSIPNINWRWKRLVSRRSWTITKNAQGTGWTVMQRTKRGAPPARRRYRQRRL